MDLKQQVEIELSRRRTLQNIISKVIDQEFLINSESRVRRGVVQKRIAEKLGVKENNVLAKAVIDYLATEGVEPIVIHGKNYFKNLCEKRFALQNEDLEGI